MTTTDPFTHMEQAWLLEGNPFPAEAISKKESEPYADVFPDERLGFYRKLIRGGLVNDLHVGFLWSQGTRSDTGFGKTRLMRHAREEINADLGDRVLEQAGLGAKRRSMIAAAYTNLNNLNASSLYQVVFNAVGDLARPIGETRAVLERVRQAIVSRLAKELDVAASEVPASSVSDALRTKRLELYPGAPPLRSDIVNAFGEGGTAIAAALGAASSATRMRSGLEYLDFAITALVAGGIERLFLFVDQLEDLATNRSMTAAKRSREIGRIRDLLEEEPYASRLHMVFTFHNSAARVLERFWEEHRLPRFEIAADNESAVVVLRGLTTDDQASEILKVYLNSKRSEPADDDLLPFDADAVGLLRTVSEGRVGVLLARAHQLLEAGARAGVPVITADFARTHFSGAGVEIEAEPDGGSDGGDLDDLLLG